MSDSFHPADRDLAGDASDPATGGDTPASSAGRCDEGERGPTPWHSNSPPADFQPVGVAPRINGWTAERQRIFIQTLSECGSVSEACEAAGCTPRSAYRLRLRPGAESFDAAWKRAYETGIHRLTAIAPLPASAGR